MSSFVAGAYASLERASRSRQITDLEFHDRIKQVRMLIPLEWKRDEKTAWWIREFF